MPLSHKRDRKRKKLERIAQHKAKHELLTPETIKEILAVQPDSNLVQPKLEKVGLRLEGNRVVGLTKEVKPVRPISWYDPNIKRIGQLVRMWQYGKVVVIIEPELDADGNIIETSSTGRLVSDNVFTPSFVPDPKPEKRQKRSRW